MTRQGNIELLQDQVQHRRITIDELEKQCEDKVIDMFDEVIHPIGYNLCDRCGDYGDSELDFLWVDYYPWEDDNPKDQAILKALELEGIDYCAVCWECVEKLTKKGAEEMEHDHDEYVAEVERKYDDYLQKTEDRCISYGEMVYLHELSEYELDALCEEIDKELGDEE